MAKTNRIYFLILSVTIFLLSVSCSKEAVNDKPDFEKSFRKAVKLFNDENYREAIDDFRSILLNHSGENGIDSVRFLIAKSHFELGEYYSASYEFLRLTESYPESELVEGSYFLDAECYRMLSPRYTLDQAETRRALSKYQVYLDLYQKGKYSADSDKIIIELREKLARKEYEAGVLYLKMDQPRAAKVYFNQIIDNYYDTTYYPLSLEKIADAYLAMKDEYNHRVYTAKYLELKQKIKE